MSCCDGDYQAQTPAPPPRDGHLPLAERARNFAAAAVRFAAGGFRTTSPAMLDHRLALCGGCERRRGELCTACGCIIDIKARMPAEFCPLGRWPDPNSPVPGPAPSPAPETPPTADSEAADG